MAWNGSGTFVLTDGTYTSTWAANWRDNGAATITAAEFDALLLDVKNGINACLAKNGENSATANLNMGGNRLTNLGTPSANSDAGTYGKQVASGAYDSGGDQIVLTLQDGATISFSTAALSAGTGGVALTGDQTASGVKTWSGIGSHSNAKFNGPTKSKVAVPTPGSTVTIDTTAANAHYVTVGTNTNVTFTWPTAASDTELGANWTITGKVLFRHTGAGYTITLNSTMLSALDYYEEEGAEATGSGDLSTLVYSYMYIGGTKIAQFAWVATP